ncbi:hypothetical protein H257_03562 [Aphanomyces astaci]|uniref:Uncharacterized protein n=2 Tax=Aphanomyces astaci TaxID=112090 RepID=W4GZ78_APHAT|nr:hypothetical protein H257_03562 [Aphanomyces astaci]ETV84319.1 hypothetical protein H257_03562 [Aphanomyces astaci]RHY39649.1 hypothetical protein DYB34_007925 [Aphanomyces astaci]RHY62979.1 hypothetical protein DYB30_006910 [Aphanomyces astaci]RHY92770.1 hypothetical protein DYB35_001822 [Aphanomyces astaci]RHZ20014.1 hypothetical protein DYB37_001761 [Aphanomyces astaci]|eukprot:XP_009826011.1 hypothetical protein H257_03562 [Aphanomyces astaci]
MGVHGVPAQGMECLATMEDITSETYVEYQTFPSLQWHPCQFSAEVVTQLQEAQFPAFMKGVQEPDCKAELRRLLAKGPPIWVEDKYGFPLPDNGDTHVVALWFSSTNEEKSAKLHGAVEGDEREKLWSELKELLQAMEDDKEEVRD